jgi:peptide/nickel transport system substrate-binding protein
MRRILLILVAMALVATACGGDDEPTISIVTVPGETVTVTSVVEVPVPGETVTVTEIVEVPVTVAPVEVTGGRLVVAETTPPVTFDPTQSALIKTWFPWQLAFDSLILQKADGSFEPRLATSWVISDDGLTFTFTLREGVTFHNGQPFEADDVVYTFERAKSGGIPYTLARVGGIESVTAIDAMTVEMKLAAFDAGFFNNLGNTYPVGTAILNREAGATTNPAVFMVGTGPFKMVSYAPERELVLAANENYWDTGRPKVDELVIRYIPEQQAQLAALQAGEVDIMFPEPESALVLASDSNVTVQEVVSANIIRLNVNSGAAPLDNVDVRRALALGIDRQEIVDGALLGSGAPSSYIPQAYGWSIPPDQAAYQSRDVDAAKALLAGAGFPDGFDIELMSLAGYGAYLDRMVEILKDQWADIGVNATIVPQELATWLDRLLTANYEITDNEFSYQADPFQYLRVRRERQGPAPAIIDDLEAQAKAAGPDELVGILVQIAEAQADLVYPDIPIAARIAFTAFRNEVSGVAQDFTNSYRFLIDVGKN